MNEFLHPTGCGAWSITVIPGPPRRSGAWMSEWWRRSRRRWTTRPVPPRAPASGPGGGRRRSWPPGTPGRRSRFPPATVYRVMSPLEGGRHTFGSAVRRRSNAGRPAAPFTVTAAPAVLVRRPRAAWPRSPGRWPSSTPPGASGSTPSRRASSRPRCTRRKATRDSAAGCPARAGRPDQRRRGRHLVPGVLPLHHRPSPARSAYRRRPDRRPPRPSARPTGRPARGSPARRAIRGGSRCRAW